MGRKKKEEIERLFVKMSFFEEPSVKATWLCWSKINQSINAKAVVDLVYDIAHWRRGIASLQAVRSRRPQTEVLASMCSST